jgi:hypothetical protein
MFSYSWFWCVPYVRKSTCHFLPLLCLHFKIETHVTWVKFSGFYNGYCKMMVFLGAYTVQHSKSVPLFQWKMPTSSSGWPNLVQNCRTDWENEICKFCWEVTRMVRSANRSRTELTENLSSLPFSYLWLAIILAVFLCNSTFSSYITFYPHKPHVTPKVETAGSSKTNYATCCNIQKIIILFCVLLVC